MKLTHTPVSVLSPRQESRVKFVSRLIGGQVLDLHLEGVEVPTRSLFHSL